MDLSYLLWLQDLRNALPPAVTELMLAISAIAASSALVIIPCILYWCLDKRAGQFLVFSFSISTLCNQLVKNTVCCYRSWIRSADIHPVEGALEEATGYSFPSGHTATATSLIGALGWQYRRKLPALFAGSVVFVLLVAFSRNFLGVHTPQDVVAGMLVGILAIAAATRLQAWVDQQDGRDRLVLVVGIVAAVVFVAFTALKPYPQDFDATGAILVDPVVMQIDSFKAAGVFLGAVLGWFLERRYVNFDTDRSRPLRRHLMRFCIGIAAVAVLHLAPRLLLFTGIETRWFELVKNFLTIFGAVFVGPLAFTAVERRLGK